VISAPAVGNGLAIFGRTGDFSVYAIDLAKSAAAHAPVFAWRRSTLMYVFGSAAVAGENAYIGSFNGKLFALDLATGAEKWVFQTDASRAHWDEFYRDDRFQTSLFSRFQRQGAPFDAAGLIDALFTMGSVLSSPWVADGIVYFGSADGTLYALDLE
jgi:outer membrane protein assembly factor BamB